MDRGEFINATINRDMKGLEIGPSYAPSLPKRDGWSVEIVDHTTADELREKYAYKEGAPHIEHVDHVWLGGDLDQIVPNHNSYDYIFASHVVEHLIDLVGFFKSCEKLLKPEGQLVLVVPDKRQCFDFLRPITSTGDLLESFGSTEAKHRKGKIYDFFSYTADLGGHITWESNWAYDLKLRPSFAHDVQDAYQRYRDASESDEYYDVHSWNFVPSSFRLIMNDLADCGVLNIRENAFHTTRTCEFYFSASKNGRGVPIGRMDIIRDIAREQIQGLSQIIAS